MSATSLARSAAAEELNPRRWWIRYPGAVVGFFRAQIAVAQVFPIVRSINAGEPFGKLNLFMASGSLFTLCGLVLLLFRKATTADGAASGSTSQRALAEDHVQPALHHGGTKPGAQTDRRVETDAHGDR